MSRNTVEIAGQLKRLMVRGSPLLEEYTTQTCPACTEVCCRHKHGLFRERDAIYLTALGINVPPHDETRPPEGPANFSAMKDAPGAVGSGPSGAPGISAILSSGP